MRIAKPLVGLLLSGTLAIGLVMAQDDLDLDDLLGDLDAETVVEDAGEAVEAVTEDAMGDLDDLFGDLEDMPMKGAEETAESVDDFLEGAFDDAGTAPEAIVEAIESDATATDDLDVDLTDLLGESDAEASEDVMADLTEVVDEGEAAMEEGAEESMDDLLDGMDDLMPEVAETVVEDPAEPVVDLMDDTVDMADEVAPALDDMLDDMAEPAVEMADEVAPALDDMLDDMTEPAVMDEPELSINDLIGDVDEAASEVEEAVAEVVTMEPEMAEPVTEIAEPMVEAAEPVMEEAAAVATDVPDDLIKEAQEVSIAERVRMRAREMDGLERVKDGFDAMSRQDYEEARNQFDEALRLIPERDSTRSTIQSARWGHSDASLEIAKMKLDAGDTDAAQAALEQALEYNPENRGVARVEKKLAKVMKYPVRTPVRKRETTITRRDQIQDLLVEGRDLFENKMYDESETVFDQVRLLDEYNITAMQFLKRIEDRRYKLANIERERSVARMVQEVRDKWNPPLRKDIERPELDEDQPEVGTGDAVEDKLLQKMKDLVIPSIEFRNANIIDVVEELRKESERNDTDEGTGINIVLKLSGGTASAAPSGLGLEISAPRGGDEFDDFGDFGGGGFDDFGGGGFDEPDFDQPAAVNTGGGGEFAVPKITLTLRKISLYDALKIITEYADLKFKIENQIVFITPKSQITEPLETRVYAVQPSLIEIVVESEEEEDAGSRDEFVEMGKAKTFRRVDVKVFFQQAGVPFPPGTSITYNAATSQLIVRNTQDNLEVFERILPNFNIPPTQVEIEARFVEILQEDLEELGVEWILTDDYEVARNTQDGILGGAERVQIDADERGLSQGLRFLNSGAAGTEPGGRTALDEIGFLGDILSFSSVLTNPEMRVILHALNQRGGTDLLSAPRITTRSGITASIEVVQEIIYPTEFEAESASSRIDVSSSGDNEVNVPGGVVIFPESFETREVGVIMNVTPTVGPDKYTIDLALSPEVSELVSWIQYGTPPFNIPQPIFASRNATTSIVIWDGQTVVMGGLINEELIRYEDKIPFLGDLPFIGKLFRSKGERSAKRNLLIFVTARIVDPAGQVVNKEKAVASAVSSSGPAEPDSP